MKEQEKMDFGQALRIMCRGFRVARENWNGKGMFLTIQMPDEHSKMTRPYIYITTVKGDRVPWVASQDDLLEWDWVQVP